MYKWENLDYITKEYTCLIAGVPGSGKSVLLDSLIYNFASENVALYIIDLKRVQFNKWQGLPQLRRIAKDIDSALDLLDSFSDEMESRYRAMESTRAVKYTGQRAILIIDEMADLMTYKGVEKKLLHIMRLARAANMSLYMATQSPNRKVITANIQNCCTSAVGLRCRSAIESRQIIGMAGCEDLPKYGWGIMQTSDSEYLKIQIGMTSDEMIADAIKEVRAANGLDRPQPQTIPQPQNRTHGFFNVFKSLLGFAN